MQRFYEYLAGANKVNALKQAQISLFYDTEYPVFHHPYYWAAFTLIAITDKGKDEMVNFGQKINLIKRNFEMGGYTIVAKECVGLIEQAFRQLFSKHLTHLDEKDRPENPESRIRDWQR